MELIRSGPGRRRGYRRLPVATPWLYGPQTKKEILSRMSSSGTRVDICGTGSKSRKLLWEKRAEGSLHEKKLRHVGLRSRIDFDRGRKRRVCTISEWFLRLDEGSRHRADRYGPNVKRWQFFRCELPLLSTRTRGRRRKS